MGQTEGSRVHLNREIYHISFICWGMVLEKYSPKEASAKSAVLVQLDFIPK